MTSIQDKPATYRRAVTFGMKYDDDNPHPAGVWAHADGYIIVETATLQEWREFVVFLVGKTSSGAIAFAFDYDAEAFEAPGGSADRHHPLGLLATFSSLPIQHKSKPRRGPVAVLSEVNFDRENLEAFLRITVGPITTEVYNDKLTLVSHRMES